MLGKEIVKSIFEVLLSEKLGGERYKQYGENLNESVIEFINKEAKVRGLKPGAANNILQSAVRQIKKAKNAEEVLTILSESMFRLR